MLFGNPIFLWGLLALPIPLLIHLYFRRRRTRVKFSTTQFFRKMEKPLAFRRRLRDYLLLFLRTLALLLLVLALSRPSIGGMKQLSGGRTHTVIILDDTLSMCRRTASGETAYDSARHKAKEILGALEPGDSASLVFISGRKGLPPMQDTRRIDATVNDSGPCGSGGSYPAAFKQALENFSPSEDAGREIFLISDFQASQAPSQPFKDERLRDVKVSFVPVAGAIENLSVARVSTGSKPKTVGKAMRIEYEIENFGKSEQKTELRLEIGGKTADTREISIAGGGRISGELAFVPLSEGLLSGSVGIKDDSYALDNRRHFAASVSKNVKVLGVYQDEFVRSDPYFFLKHALDPDGSTAHGISFSTATAKELTPEILAGVHVVVLGDIDVLPEKVAAALSAHIRNGGSIVSFPGARTSATSMAGLTDILKKEGLSIGGVYGAKIPFKGFGIVFGEDLAVLNSLLQLDCLSWKYIQEIALEPPLKILASAEGKGVIAERSAGNGRWIAVACPARNDYCNWPALKSFPVTMIHLFDHAANGTQDVRNLVCGSKIRLSPLSDTVEVSGPSGSATMRAVKGETLTYEDTWMPGVVNFHNADIKAAVFNGEPAESRPEMLDKGKLKTAIIDHEISIMSPDRTIAEQVSSARKGGSMAGFFILLLFCTALAEFLFADNHQQVLVPATAKSIQ